MKQFLKAHEAYEAAIQADAFYDYSSTELRSIQSLAAGGEALKAGEATLALEMWMVSPKIPYPRGVLESAVRECDDVLAKSEAALAKGTGTGTEAATGDSANNRGLCGPVR